MNTRTRLEHMLDKLRECNKSLYWARKHGKPLFVKGSYQSECLDELEEKLSDFITEIEFELGESDES